MSPVRARREASKRLGLALQLRYMRLLEATGDDEVAAAAVELGSTFNDNIEFIVQVLKSFGGLDVKFETIRQTPANDAPKKGELQTGEDPDLGNDWFGDQDRKKASKLPIVPMLLTNGE
jgi:hypothetical protein